MMNVEQINVFRNMASNLSSNSPVAEYDDLVAKVCEIYLARMAEVLTGATTPTLAQERIDVLAAVATLQGVLDVNTRF